jgi:hypothetical protein
LGTELSNNTKTGGVGVTTTDKLYLLSYNDVYAENSIYTALWNAGGRRADITDFALANYGFELTIGGHDGYWWLRSAHSASYVRRVGYSGSAFQELPTTLNLGLRPAMSLSIQAFTATSEVSFGNGIRNGTAYIEFGYYPKTAVSGDLVLELETAFNEGDLINGMFATNKIFTTNDYTAESGFSAVDNAEYYYNGARYVRFVLAVSSGTYTYSDGEILGEGGSVKWFKVEPIKWLIANWDSLPDNSNGGSYDADTTLILIAAEELFSGIPFSASDTAWETSLLRNFLNTSFLAQSFTAAEIAAIAQTEIDNSTTSGNAASDDTTNDRVFLLSYADVYGDDTAFAPLWNNGNRVSSPTDFALASGGEQLTNGNHAGHWWLRSANSASTMYLVDEFGIPTGNIAYESTMFGVRPAITVNLYTYLEL